MSLGLCVGTQRLKATGRVIKLKLALNLASRGTRGQVECTSTVLVAAENRATQILF